MLATASKPGFISNLFVGTDRRLRPIVCALSYAALAFWLLSADWVLGPVLERVASALRVRGLSPGTVVFFETINLLTALLLTWIFARYEHRRVDSYGLPVREAFGARYWEGFAIGVVNAGAVALGMIALGRMTVHGLPLHGSKILSGALAWLGACALVGVAEELLFRGYLLQTLWRSLGFWPAAVLISAWFAADHYFFKQGENVWDVITLVTLGLWACYSVLRTGTPVAGRGLSCLIRLHAAIRHWNEKRQCRTSRSPAERIVPGTGLGDRRCAGH